MRKGLSCLEVPSMGKVVFTLSLQNLVSLGCGLARGVSMRQSEPCTTHLCILQRRRVGLFLQVYPPHVPVFVCHDKLEQRLVREDPVGLPHRVRS